MRNGIPLWPADIVIVRKEDRMKLSVDRVVGKIKELRKHEAERYVNTDEVSGQLQLELLKREGCSPTSHVLEFGCGHLHLGAPLIEFLDKKHYVGVDPNEWLRKHAMEKEKVRKLVEEKQATFLTRDDFDAGELGRKFDYIFSHSVLSHAAHWQLEQYLRNSANVLNEGGRILSSIRLAEGNAFGSEGSPDKEDSMDEEWVYPGVSWFKESTIVDTAAKLGLTATHKPEYVEFYTKTRPGEYHDWFVFTWKTD
jgi:cyclopropane fatty-acyl-phospholipid synthase-like methyltransferase